MAKPKQNPKEADALMSSSQAAKYLAKANATTLDAAGLRREVLDLHEKRLAPGLEHKKITPDKLRKVLVKEQATRSRVLSIFLETMAAYNALLAMRDHAVMWMIANKSEAFLVTTKTEQKAYAAHMFSLRNPILEDLKETKDAAEAVMLDVDRAAWNLKALLSTYELATRPEAFGLA